MQQSVSGVLFLGNSTLFIALLLQYIYTLPTPCPMRDWTKLSSRKEKEHSTRQKRSEKDTESPLLLAYRMTALVWISSLTWETRSLIDLKISTHIKTPRTLMSPRSTTMVRIFSGRWKTFLLTSKDGRLSLRSSTRSGRWTSSTSTMLICFSTGTIATSSGCRPMYSKTSM